MLSCKAATQHFATSATGKGYRGTLCPDVALDVVPVAQAVHVPLQSWTVRCIQRYAAASAASAKPIASVE